MLDMGDEAGEMFLKRRSGAIDYATGPAPLDHLPDRASNACSVHPPAASELIDEQTMRLWFEELRTRRRTQ